jgi:diguanylate cyclase (GGDEF)-like protein
LLLILFATLIPALVGGVQFLERRDYETSGAKDDLVATAQRTAQVLRDTVRATAQLHYGLSRARNLDTQDKEACSAFLADVLKEHSQYTGILTITPGGDLFCDSLRTGRALHLTDRRYFQDALHSKNPLAIEPAFGRLTGMAVLQIAYAARRETGEPKFVLLASLNLEKHMQFLANSLPRETAMIALMDGKGTILTWHPEGEKLRGTSIADSPLFRLAREHPDGAAWELTEAGGESRIWAVSALPEFPEAGLYVLVGVSRKDLLAAANRQLSQALAILGIVSLLVFTGAWMLMELSIRRPVARTIAAVGRFSGGDFGARIGEPYPRGELGGLMSSVDHAFKMLQTQREKIDRLTRGHVVLSRINGLIVRVSERDELFREVCRIAVEDGRFRMAWIGVVDREAMRVRPVARHGTGEDYVRLMPLQLSDPVSVGSAISGRVVLERRAVVSNDMTRDPRILLGKEALERGFRSLAMLPLLVGEEAVAILALYAGEIAFFDEQEMKLLHELAGDISFALDHIEKSEKLDYLAYYDSMTGLANRTLFHERLEQGLAAAGREQRKLALIVLDIERFKTINDTLGRQAGDALLKQVADRMAGNAPDSASLGRIGADHFAIMTTDIQNADDLARLTKRRLEAFFGPPFRIGETELRIAAKLGLAMFPGDGADAETLFRNAEAALKKAKASGERYLFYTQAMNEHVAEKLALENKLRQALEKDEFVLHYQPKVNLETRRIVGVEALIRWQSPELGLVPPMKFIPLMEETGLILPVGSWALKRAALDHRAWVEARLKPPRVAVNVSAIQLHQRDFVDMVERAIMEGVAPVGIDLEITESLIMQDVESTIEKLKKVRALGIKVAIDDFGTGHSSLAYLAKLPVETLKIDRSFVIRMLDDPDTATLVQTMISLAHSLRLTVVAEGVDSEEQAKVLRLLRCDEMQGYLFSRPVPFDQLTALLKEGSKG